MILPDMNTQYRSVTISGLPGAGSSTLGINLAKVLNWEYFSGGDFMRAYAVSHGLFDKNNRMHHPATVYADEYDRQVDYSLRRRLKKDSHLVVDSWLAGFLAQGVERVFKILMICSNDAVRVDRIVNRDNVSVAKAKDHIFEREELNLTKWKRMYQDEWRQWVGKTPIDFYHPKLYDLVIDTYSHDRQTTLNLVLNQLGEKNV
jgi:cytidylate kinase